MEKNTLDDEFKDLVGNLYFELNFMNLENPKGRDFVEDEMDKLQDSLGYGYWHCKIGAQRILHKKDNSGRSVSYSPRALELARNVLDYEI